MTLTVIDLIVIAVCFAATIGSDFGSEIGNDVTPYGLCNEASQN